MADPLYMRTKEFSQIIGVSQKTVREHCAAGKVPGAVRFGAAWLIPMEYVRKYTHPKDISPAIDESKPKCKPIEALEIVGSKSKVIERIEMRLRAKGKS